MRAASFLLVATVLPAVAHAQPGSSVPPPAFLAAKASRLLRTQLPCLGCHELGGEGGKTAPSLSSVRQRRDAAYIRAMVDDPQRVVPGSAMPRVPMLPATRAAVLAYLGGDTAAAAAPAPRVAPSPAPAVPPGTLYQRWCSSCHGSRGKGDGPNASLLPVRPAIHASAAQMSARSDDVLFDAIAGGGAVMGKSPRMPPFGATLTPAEIRSLVSYIRTLCACTGPAWSRDGAP